MEVKREAKFKDSTSINFFLFFPIILLIHIFLFICFPSTCSFSIVYSLDNYRYVLSASLQVVGSIFSFIASSTLVVLQLLHSATPNGVRLYPKRVFFLFLVVATLVLLIDTFTLLVLPIEITILKQSLLNLIITLNIYPLLFAFVYIFFAIQYVTPTNQVKRIIRAAKAAKNNEERRRVVFALEEMVLTAIKSGQGGNAKRYIDVFSEIIEIFLTTKTSLNSNSSQEPSNPLRTIPDVIERIAANLVDNDMNNILHYTGHILRELSGSKYEGKTIVDVEIAIAAENIAKKCLEKKNISDLTNFSANFIMCADENANLHTVFWGAEMMIDILDPSIPEIASDVFWHIINDIHYCIMHSSSTEHKTISRTIDMIEKKTTLIDTLSDVQVKTLSKRIDEMRQHIQNPENTDMDDKTSCLLR